MTFTVLLKEKKINSDLIKEKFNLLKKNKALGLIKINNKEILKELLLWLRILPVNFIVDSEELSSYKSNNIAFSKEETLNSWFDFIISEDNKKWLELYLKIWVTPIISESNNLKTIFKEFNPLKNDGNSYLYKNNNSWDIFYSLIRYLENYKFTFDNKNLVKNVFETET